MINNITLKTFNQVYETIIEDLSTFKHYKYNIIQTIQINNSPSVPLRILVEEISSSIISSVIVSVTISLNHSYVRIRRLKGDAGISGIF